MTGISSAGVSYIICTQKIIADLTTNRLPQQIRHVQNMALAEHSHTLHS